MNNASSTVRHLLWAHQLCSCEQLNKVSACVITLSDKPARSRAHYALSLSQRPYFTLFLSHTLTLSHSLSLSVLVCVSVGCACGHDHAQPGGCRINRPCKAAMIIGVVVQLAGSPSKEGVPNGDFRSFACLDRGIFCPLIALSAT